MLLLTYLLTYRTDMIPWRRAGYYAYCFSYLLINYHQFLCPCGVVDEACYWAVFDR